MKYVALGIVLAIALVFGAFKWHEMVKQERAESYRLYIEKQKQIEAEETAKKKESEEKAKAIEDQIKTTKAFRDYLSRERKKLEKIIEESKIHIKLIAEDKQTLSAALAEIDAENIKKSESARKQNRKRFDRAERVMQLLRSQTLNELAASYLGEDFAALGAEYQSHMATFINMYDEEKRRLAKNKKDYDKAVEGIQDEIERKNRYASERVFEARRSGSYQLDEFKKRLSKAQSDAELIRRKKLPSKQEKEKLLHLENVLIPSLEQAIVNMEQSVALGIAEVAHMEATVAESAGRSKFDAAITTRQDADNAVHSDMAHERAVFALAVQYENRSLDMIRSTMRAREDILSARVDEARKSLDYILRIADNVDMLTIEEIKETRVDISKKLRDSILKITE